MSEYKYSLPVLFKKTATGAIQKWMIGVEGTTIVTIYGQVGGAIQTTRDLIKSGKNQGRKNETVAEEQATKEAFSRWEKKKKSGYVISIAAAKAGEVDEIIEGGVSPMLAKVYSDHSSKIIYPVAVQPKLDGHRCIAVIDEKGDVTLWTRTRKRITSVPHIEEKIRVAAKKMKISGVILDGELYNHAFKDDFEKLTSITRKKEATLDSVRIQYHVYDSVSPKGFLHRLNLLADITLYGGSVLELVETHIADSEEKSLELYDLFKKQGYEGAMIRQLDMGYENKRSAQLLKMKEFVDREFEVIGVEEGRGKLTGHAGAFVCRNPNGVGDEAKEFRAKMAGDTEKLKEYWQNRSQYIGQLLTVKYQGLTSDGIPRFPVGLRIREDI